MPENCIVFRVAAGNNQFVREVVVFVDDDVERREVVVPDHFAHHVDAVGRSRRLLDLRPVGKSSVFYDEGSNRSLDIAPEALFDFRESSDLHRGEVELEDEERVPEGRRNPPDVGLAEEFVETVLEVDVVVVREH